MAFSKASRTMGWGETKLALAWSPWRAVAARGLWAYYRVAKGREGVS